MRLVLGVVSLVALAFLLAEFFIVFLLPRTRFSAGSFVSAMARHLALDLPDWLPRREVREEWQAVAGLP
jgi:hypothetical protein